ncbi:MAG: ComF family protein [Brachymonas sp.]|jgi:predicted amidophosphoribosyltransferase
MPLLPAPIRLCADCLRTDAKNLPAPAACWAAVDYSGPWRTLVQRWKLGQQPALAQAAAQLMVAQLPWNEILAGVDALVPIPASPQSLRERGFQPTLGLARALSSHLTPSLGALPPMWPQALLRLPERDALHQALRGRQARLRAMQGAFIVPPAALPQIQGRKLLLLDDVMTTGATLSSAAQALHQAGAAQVQAVVLARTPRA